ncbi:hypothetical protein [Klebsiella pneumoniae]|uniref:hypothetical protein n=1 Tax=Klebsiella pneumoniae TaxID=573 RepID=UPI0034641490
MITLEDSQVKNLLASSELAGEPLDQHIVSKLDELSSSALTDSAILEIALKRVMAMPDNTFFSLKEILSDVWDQIESPKSFGRLFKQKSSHYAAYEGVNSSNKATYRKYTINPLTHFSGSPSEDLNTW